MFAPSAAGASLGEQSNCQHGDSFIIILLAFEDDYIFGGKTINKVKTDKGTKTDFLRKTNARRPPPHSGIDLLG